MLGGARSLAGHWQTSHAFTPAAAVSQGRLIPVRLASNPAAATEGAGRCALHLAEHRAIRQAAMHMLPLQLSPGQWQTWSARTLQRRQCTAARQLTLHLPTSSGTTKPGVFQQERLVCLPADMTVSLHMCMHGQHVVCSLNCQRLGLRAHLQVDHRQSVGVHNCLQTLLQDPRPVAAANFLLQHRLAQVQHRRLDSRCKVR